MIVKEKKNTMWACVAKVGGLSLLSDILSDVFKISLWSFCQFPGFRGRVGPSLLSMF